MYCSTTTSSIWGLAVT